MQKIKVFLLSFCWISCLIAKDAQNLHRYMWASYKHSGGKMQEAYDWHNQIDEHASVYTNKGYIHLLNDTNRYEEITKLVPKLDKAFEVDPDVQLIFALAFKKVGNNAQADDRLIRLSRKFKDNPEVIFGVAETYVRRKEPENAITAIDDYLNSAPKRANNFVFYYLKAQIYMQMNKHTQAIKNINESLSIHPHFPQGWLLYALMNEQAGKIAEAIKGYTAYLEISPNTNQQIEQRLLQLVLKQKSIQRQNKPLLMTRSCFEKALALLHGKQYKQALVQIDQCLAQKPNDTDGRLIKIQILTGMSKIDEAVKTLASWIEQEPDNDLWLKTLHIFAYGKAPVSKLISALEPIHAKHTKSLLPTLYLADLHTRARNTKQALFYHEKALQLTNDATLKTKIYFQIGVIHYEQSNYTAMKNALERGYALKTDFPPLLNMLAYYYATKGKQLDVAQKYMTQTLQKDKNNPHFLDTQALIFYKQKNYDKARNLFEKLVQKEPNDALMQIHLAKTYLKQHNTKQAQAILSKAKQHAKPGYEERVVEKLLKRVQG